MSHAPHPRFESLAALLDHRGTQQPDLPLYRFVRDGDRVVASLTCGQLLRAVRELAARLTASGLAGERALLVYPPGLELIVAFLGCAYAGVIAVPVYPPNPGRLVKALPPLLGIVGDARPRAILGTGATVELVRSFAGQLPGPDELCWLATDAATAEATATPPAEALPAAPPAMPGAATLAFLQYTSGSTGTPKGVALTHGNVLHNLSVIEARFQHTAQSVGVIWLPSYHDMGLIGGILQPLYAGFPVVLMSPLDFLKRPASWLRAITRFRATTSGGPPFSFDLCTRNVPDEAVAELDLSSWKLAFVGADAIRQHQLTAFAQKFAPCGFRPEAFYPCYGLAEATLYVTGGAGDPATLPAGAPLPGGGDPAQQPVGCGRPSEDTVVRIVSPETCAPVAEGQIGEIWVRGPSVAAGYWGNPRATEETFGARLAGPGLEPGADPGQARYLRTGDLGLVRGGELYVTGRLKEVLKIRGKSYYPADLEATIEEVDGELIRRGCSATFLARDDSELIVVVEVRSGALVGAALPEERATELCRRVRTAITSTYGLSVSSIALTRLGTVPKTSSGKVRRMVCRDMYVAGEIPVLGLWQRNDTFTCR